MTEHLESKNNSPKTQKNGYYSFLFPFFQRVRVANDEKSLYICKCSYRTRTIISGLDLKKYNENRRGCDVYINPDLKGYDATSFSPAKITDIFKRSEAAGEGVCEQLEQLKLKVLK